MAWLMAVILIVFTLFAYLRWKRDLLSPCFLLCLALTASYLIVLLNYENWQVDINSTFVLYITTAVAAFIIGASVIDVCCGKDKPSKYSSRDRILAIARVKYPVNILMIISACLSVLYIGKLFLDAGFSTSISVMLRRIYDNIVQDNYSPGIAFIQMSEIVRAIAYINMFRLIVRLFLRKKNDRISIIKLAIPIILFLVVTLVATDRNILLRFAIFSLCILIAVYDKTRRKKSNVKIICIVVIAAAAALLVFYLFGKAKMYQSDLSRALGIYGGSGLYCFNLWVKDFNGPLMYGKSTFTTLLNTLQVTILSPFNVDFGLHTVRFDALIIFTSPNGYVFSSNIYTALRPYVEDFGYFGVILFPMIIGCVLQFLYRMYKRKGMFACILYCALIYFAIYIPIQEQCFRRMHLGMLYEIFWLAAVYFSVYNKSSYRQQLRCLYENKRERSKACRTVRL